MKPLGRDESLSEICKLVAGSSWFTIAAPYFGRGALKQLGLQRYRGQLTIYCDLLSGACNPKEIQAFIDKFGADRVLTVDGLHAKIYVSDKGIVVGSANPSANGLNFEGVELTGQIEACVATSSTLAVGEWKKWIQDNIAPRSREITDRDMAEGTRRWRARRASRVPRGAPKSFWNQILLGPDGLVQKPIFVVAYRHEPSSPAARNAFDAEKRARKVAGLDYYDNWPNAPAGAIMIDFQYGSRGRYEFTGLYRILEKGVITLTKKESITLCQEVNAVDGMPLRGKGVEEFTRHLQDLAPPSTYPYVYVSAADFAKSVGGHGLVGNQVPPPWPTA